jgi:hypothetical protein
MTDARGPAQIAEALEARARENDSFADAEVYPEDKEQRAYYRCEAAFFRAAAAKIRALADLALRAEEELRLIRMKDSGAVYDTTLRADMSRDLRAARSALARGED